MEWQQSVSNACDCVGASYLLSYQLLSDSFDGCCFSLFLAGRQLANAFSSPCKFSMLLMLCLPATTSCHPVDELLAINNPACLGMLLP